MMRSILLALLAAILLQGCGESGPALSVSSLQVVAPAPGRTPSVAYMTITNQGRSAVELLAVSSPLFARVEMHQTVLKDGVARMQSLSTVTVESKSEVVFAPGGKHLMLFDPTKGLTPGTEVSLQFKFASGELLVLTSPLITRLPVD
jgi:copper(I)-binding protein